MSRALTIELSEAAYAGLERLARAAASTPKDLAAAALEDRFRSASGPTDDVGAAAASIGTGAGERLATRFGSVDLGRATGSDNESIDADLVRAYADRHGDG